MGFGSEDLVASEVTEASRSASNAQKCRIKRDQSLQVLARPVHGIRTVIRTYAA